MTARRTPAVDDLRADLLADLAAGQPLPGQESVDTTPRPKKQPAALEMRFTPTRWAVLRRTDHGLKVGPVSLGLSREKP